MFNLKSKKKQSLPVEETSPFQLTEDVDTRVDDGSTIQQVGEVASDDPSPTPSADADEIMSNLAGHFAGLSKADAGELKALGLMVYEIPQDTPAFDEAFGSLREQLVHRLMGGQSREPVDVRSQALLIEALQLAEESREGSEEPPLSVFAELCLHKDPEVESAHVEEMEQKLDATMPSAEIAEIAEIAESTEAVDEVSRAPACFGEVDHAEALLTEVQAAAKKITAEAFEIEFNPQNVDGELTAKIASHLTNVGRDAFIFLNEQFEEEIRLLQSYKETCAEIEAHSLRKQAISRSMSLIKDGIEGKDLELLSNNVEKEDNWIFDKIVNLGKARTEFAALSNERQARIAEISQAMEEESKACDEELSTLRLNMMESPSDIIESLLGNDAEQEQRDHEERPEEKIDLYIEWMTEQRQKITEQRERFRELEHRLRDEKDKVYSQFQREIQIKSEHVEKLEGQLIEVLNTATLDANENNGRIEQLFDDSRVLLSLYDDSAAKRHGFAANVEEIMAGAMIALGQIIDHINVEPETNQRVNNN